MRPVRLPVLYLLITFVLGSCQFECSVGKDSGEPEGKARVENDARIYNDIKITSYKANLKRAYLRFEDGSRVPDDNFIDFTQPVNLILDFDGGWSRDSSRVFLGASEKIIDERGQVLVDAPDLFEKYTTQGISEADAKRITIKATIRIRENTPPTSFSVQFRVWDKGGDAYVEGSYMLFSK
jgi:hypothetical protein